MTLGVGLMAPDPHALPESVHSNTLVRLLGFTTDKQLRKLSNQGILPAFSNALWPTIETLSALFAYYQKRLKEGSEDEQAVDADLKREQLENLRLKNAKMRRDLIPMEVVDRVWTSEIQHARTSLLGLAAKVAPQLAGCRDAAEAQALIDREVREVLSGIAENPQYEFTDDPSEENPEVSNEPAVGQQIGPEKTPE